MLNTFTRKELTDYYTQLAGTDGLVRYILVETTSKPGFYEIIGIHRDPDTLKRVARGLIHLDAISMPEISSQRIRDLKSYQIFDSKRNWKRIWDARKDEEGLSVSLSNPYITEWL